MDNCKKALLTMMKSYNLSILEGPDGNYYEAQQVLNAIEDGSIKVKELTLDVEEGPLCHFDPDYYEGVTFDQYREGIRMPGIHRVQVDFEGQLDPLTKG